jgi:hypothetical protein
MPCSDFSWPHTLWLPPRECPSVGWETWGLCLRGTRAMTSWRESGSLCSLPPPWAYPLHTGLPASQLPFPESRRHLDSGILASRPSLLPSNPLLPCPLHCVLERPRKGTSLSECQELDMPNWSCLLESSPRLLPAHQATSVLSPATDTEAPPRSPPAPAAQTRVCVYLFLRLQHGDQLQPAPEVSLAEGRPRALQLSRPAPGWACSGLAGIGARHREPLGDGAPTPTLA